MIILNNHYINGYERYITLFILLYIYLPYDEQRKSHTTEEVVINMFKKYKKKFTYKYNIS